MIREIQSDYRRYRQYGAHPIVIVFLTQGFWALFQYRVAHKIYKSKFPAFSKILQLICVFWQKWIEIITGISIPFSAKIGEGCYIGHFGNIIINANAIIGEMCNISQGVTIGVSGRGANRGVPKIGNRVYIGANAIIAGKIEVGDDCVIAANSLLTKSVTAGVTVLGVPAIIVNRNSSKGYI
ncbi:MAG: serine acetyltransferase [Zunongwangia sp.]|jgi:serine O-acetyltransferase|uniref:serine O-acetyltransferase n=1 Tax=Zunongwangia profunda TaxID=398743 RepID=UPI000C8FF9CA|nr:DapH/DapD/GlmU-related protein [Zunongwangia profunda]MAG88408.1 serine acetyltransferase [Flavobacteriaceae bacterium]MAO35687.1 serine acetyltransferase [Zunongwangia sp.]MCC4230184.1 serine acetyltransferase [Zunongwangia profunda]|tara:strand:+ start:29342 stop:29887 length:546 start_codon:yes stop_codon:yes gene_type:complete